MRKTGEAASAKLYVPQYNINPYLVPGDTLTYNICFSGHAQQTYISTNVFPLQGVVFKSNISNFTINQKKVYIPNRKLIYTPKKAFH